MRVNHISSSVIALALSTFAMASHADNNWMPPQPGNTYWQTPNWSGFNAQPPPQAYRRPPPPQAYRQAPPPNYPAQNTGRAAPPQQAPDAYRRNTPPPPPRGPYRGPNYVPDNGASAYNMPGYNRYRSNNRGWDNNKMWGSSGPRKWMNPSKRNMEQGWDDMINSPSRMGEMPGGWTAPEVTMPNPVDMGDQMQDNVKDLPEQMKDMDVGN